ncbi:uncharacterized protein CLUP02_06694 [Colletotrichum lupini]|uniref:Uncharacterized protein n=1 Tax=Colletotrichum lupini TaxID=145971 RepID=A0A9Q8SPQ8_9PEZI|nr:uncharacterized protein CLUP02_06694 [Colletotrichum lupini]UQC81208.1 hypothetical protein CLUP02_06694 [Colletotrichum lupini]
MRYKHTVSYDGYVETDTFEFGLGFTLTGMGLGYIFGNLKNGIAIKINLLTTKGQS